MDTSYKSDFYSADLLEYVVQQENVPAARVDALAADHKLHTAIESVSIAFLVHRRPAPLLYRYLPPPCTPSWVWNAPLVLPFCTPVHPRLHLGCTGTAAILHPHTASIPHPDCLTFWVFAFCTACVAHVMLQVSLKKGGAGREVIRALRFLLATPDEVQEAEEAGRSTGQWLADILEYRQLPTAMTPFNYITLSNATEMRVQQAVSPPLITTDIAVDVSANCLCHCCHVAPLYRHQPCCFWTCAWRAAHPPYPPSGWRLLFLCTPAVCSLQVKPKQA